MSEYPIGWDLHGIDGEARSPQTQSGLTTKPDRRKFDESIAHRIEPSLMRWSRKTPLSVRVLVALFLVAQFAGVVSSPQASAEAFANALDSHARYQYMHDHGRGRSADRHGDRNGDRADHCCALHAFFAGIMPPVVAIEIMNIADQRLVGNFPSVGRGLAQGRLDRPPRPCRVI